MAGITNRHQPSSQISISTFDILGAHMSKPLNIGMIGYGFMGRAHSNAYRQVSQFYKHEHRPVLKACCARNEEKIKAFAHNWGYESYETDWRKLIQRKDIDV